MSMKPGATAQPDASSSRWPRSFGPISWITPPAIATSAARPGAPLPSKTVPPRITSSADIGFSLSTAAARQAERLLGDDAAHDLGGACVDRLCGREAIGELGL